MRLSKSISILAVFLLSGLVAAAQVPSASRKQAVKSKTQRYVELVARNDVLKSSVFGVLAMTEDGDTVAAWNPGQRMIPASTLKLVTTGAALHQLGPDFKYVTKIGYSGSIKGGVLEVEKVVVQDGFGGF